MSPNREFARRVVIGSTAVLMAAGVVTVLVLFV
jgi:hypothetical protein